MSPGPSPWPAKWPPREEGRFCYIATLSPRQTEILGLAAQGYTDRAIGLRTGLAQRTVRDYLAGARERLGANNRTHLVAIAVTMGLIKIDVMPAGPLSQTAG